MSFRIATELIDQIIAEAAALPGAEVCGLLLGTREVLPEEPAPHYASGLPPVRRERGGGTVTEVRPCRNIAADPARRFEIDPAALLAAHRQARGGGAAILGCYHSHPSGRAEPSAQDAADAAPNGWLWIIATATEALAWEAVAGGELFERFERIDLNA